MRRWSDEETEYLLNNIEDLPFSELVETLGRSYASVRGKIYTLGHKVPLSIYALYKGDELLATDTAREIAEQMGIRLKQVYYYKSPYYKRRAKSDNVRTLIKL